MSSSGGSVSETLSQTDKHVSRKVYQAPGIYFIGKVTLKTIVRSFERLGLEC